MLLIFMRLINSSLLLGSGCHGIWTFIIIIIVVAFQFLKTIKEPKNIMEPPRNIRQTSPLLPFGEVVYAGRYVFVIGALFFSIILLSMCYF